MARKGGAWFGKGNPRLGSASQGKATLGSRAWESRVVVPVRSRIGRLEDLLVMHERRPYTGQPSWGGLLSSDRWMCEVWNRQLGSYTANKIATILFEHRPQADAVRALMYLLESRAEQTSFGSAKHAALAPALVDGLIEILVGGL